MSTKSGKRYLVTGGAGFIGSNYVQHLLARGEEVVIYDNLVRAGSEKNLAWLREMHGPTAFELIQGDVRDAARLTAAAREAGVIVHLEGQVAVTTSVRHADWRPGDQRVNIHDTSKAHRELGWSPKIGVREGLKQLFDWVNDHPDLFRN